jgi:hypothetical protein
VCFARNFDHVGSAHTWEIFKKEDSRPLSWMTFFTSRTLNPLSSTIVADRFSIADTISFSDLVDTSHTLMYALVIFGALIVTGFAFFAVFAVMFLSFDSWV